MILVAGARQACAQNAIGDGQRLDRNFQSGSGGRNTARPATDFNLRNDLVTGNVAGGVQFRGEVGYTSPRAFRGLVGSDALFEARSGSALSSLPAVLGGWTSDRYSLATDPIILYNRDTTVPSVRWDSGRERQPSPIDARVLIDRAGSAGTITRALERSADGLMVGSATDESGRPFAVIGSPLTGLRYQPMLEGGVRSLDMGLYDWRRFENDLRMRPTDPGRGAVAGGPRGPGASDGATGDGALAGGAAADGTSGATPPSGLGADLSTTRDASLSTGLGNSLSTTDAPRDARAQLGVGASAYDDLVKELIDRYAQRSDVRVSVSGQELQSALRGELDRLSAELGSRTPRFDRTFPGVMPAQAPALRTGENVRAAAPGGGDTAVAGNAGATAGPADAAATPPAVDATGSDAEAARPTLDQIASLLRPTGTVKTLTQEQKSQVEELVARGEARLRDGEFFFAEQAFDRALRVAPGHPMATAGLVHANLGAGLYLSAAVQLRQLFADQPAVVGLRYDPALLPGQERLKRNMEAVRDLLSKAKIDRNDYGLTLAYIGYQIGDTDAMREGLDAIQGEEAETALRLLLKKVWLNE